MFYEFPSSRGQGISGLGFCLDLFVDFGRHRCIEVYVA